MITLSSSKLKEPKVVDEHLKLDDHANGHQEVTGQVNAERESEQLPKSELNPFGSELSGGGESQIHVNFDQDVQVLNGNGSDRNLASDSKIAQDEDQTQVVQAQGQDANNNNKPKLKLVFQHVSGQPVFWNGSFALKSKITVFPCPSSPSHMNTTMQTLLSRFLPRDYFVAHNEETEKNVTAKVKLESSPRSEVVLITEQFKPLYLQDKLRDVFPRQVTEMVVYVRGLDSSISKQRLSQCQSAFAFGNPEMAVAAPVPVPETTGAGAEEGMVGTENLASNVVNNISNPPNESIAFDEAEPELASDSDEVILDVEEVSGRRILWDRNRLCFDSNARLRLPRSKLYSLKVHQVISGVVAGRYIDARKDLKDADQQLWTKDVKVVGWEDTLDVHYLFSSHTKLHLKLLLTKEDKQWQEILDAISMFTQKIMTSDKELRAHYHQIHVLEDLIILKQKIQSDNRNDEEIIGMMVKLEPKLNSVTSLIRSRDFDVDVDWAQESKSSHSIHTHSARYSSPLNPESDKEGRRSKSMSMPSRHPKGPRHFPSTHQSHVKYGNGSDDNGNGNSPINADCNECSKTVKKPKLPKGPNPMFYNW